LRGGQVTALAVDPGLFEITQGAFRLAVQIVKQPADAEDVLQDATATAVSHPGAPEPDSEAYRPWFYKVVRNKAIDRLRQLQRQRSDELIEDSIPANAGLNPEQSLINAQQKTMINQALDDLSLEQREIILLKDYHGFSYADIAMILDIPNGSVMSRLHRARLALKEMLGPDILTD